MLRNRKKRESHYLEGPSKKAPHAEKETSRELKKYIAKDEKWS